MLRILIERSVKITKQKLSFFYAIHETLRIVICTCIVLDRSVISDNTHPLIHLIQGEFKNHGKNYQ